MTTIYLNFCDEEFARIDHDTEQAGRTIVRALISLFTSRGEHPSSKDFTYEKVMWCPCALQPGALAPRIRMHVVVRGDYSCRPSWVTHADLLNFKVEALSALRKAFGNKVPNDLEIEFEFVPQSNLLLI